MIIVYPYQPKFYKYNKNEFQQGQKPFSAYGNRRNDISQNPPQQAVQNQIPGNPCILSIKFL